MWEYTQYLFFASLHIIGSKESEVRTIISYEPLWKTLQEKSISQYYLLQNGLDNKTLDSLKKGKNITLLTLEKLCKLIDCTPNDIIEFI